jgi:tRNA G18 (ribose-2'-O)-methylase SpoU
VPAAPGSAEEAGAAVSGSVAAAVLARAVRVVDPDDPRLADFRDLTRADRRPDRPGGRGLVLAEGVPVVRRLLDSPYPMRAVLGVPARVSDLAADLSGVDAPIYLVDPEMLAAVVGFHLNRGVLASADRAPPPALAGVLGSARRLAVLEGVNDHENLGALFRNAAALGVDAVLLGDRCADPLYRRSVRVSMGHVLRVPFTPLRPWPGGLELLRSAGFTVLALRPNPPSVPLTDLDPARLPRTALLLGAEGPGLTEAAVAAADLSVRIPMAPGVDSLNVATAAAIAFHHLRGAPGGGALDQAVAPGLVQRGELAVGADQAGGGAVLDDPAGVQHHHPVGDLHCGQPVRDDQRGAVGQDRA